MSERPRATRIVDQQRLARWVLANAWRIPLDWLSPTVQDAIEREAREVSKDRNPRNV